MAHRAFQRGASGFSLVEMLVGFAVLSVLVALLLAAFSNFSEITSTSRKRMEVSKQARVLFDRMTFDINSAVSSGGVRMAFRKNDALPGGTVSNNDALVLLTDAKSSDPDGRFAKVGYGVGPYQDKARGITNQTVLRYVEPFRWDQDTTTIDLTGVAVAQAIVPGILRFELAFVDDDGNIHAGPPAGPVNSDAVRQFYDNLSAMICTVATLDEDSLQKLTEVERDSLAALLPDSEDKPVGSQGDQVEPLMQRWQKAVDESNQPWQVVKGLRFHQRYFRLK